MTNTDISNIFKTNNSANCHTHKSCIYMDYAATTPMDNRVVEKMLPFLWSETGYFANPASESHTLGKRAKEAIEEARNDMAALFNTHPKNLIFTSGATEAIHLALKGAASFYKRYGNHIITCQTEHRATLEACAQLAREGFEISYLKTQKDGLIDISHLLETLRPETRLISLMWVNNETGVKQDINSIAEITRARGIILHVDAAQAVGKIPINLQEIPIDLMSFSAHKVYGPKGVGGLYICDEPKIRLTPQMPGGGQERGLRGGTLATHQIIGMAAAFSIAKQEMKQEAERLEDFRQKFLNGISACPGIFLNGYSEPEWRTAEQRTSEQHIPEQRTPEQRISDKQTLEQQTSEQRIPEQQISKHRIPGIINICFSDIEKEAILNGLSELAVSSASACAATTIEPSHVLRAMGLKSILAHRSIRFSIGRFTKESDIDRAVDLIQKLIFIR